MNTDQKTILEEFKKFLNDHRVSKKHLLELLDNEGPLVAEAPIALSIDIIVLKIAENLNRKDYAHLRAVNKVIHNIDPVPPLSCKKDVLKWSERDSTLYSTYRCRTSEKLKLINFPKISKNLITKIGTFV